MNTRYILFVTLFVLIGQFAIGATFNSNGTSGGTWNVSSSWTLVSGVDADGIPDNDDDATILIGDVIQISSTTEKVNNLIVNGSLSVSTATSRTYVYGDYTVSGSETGTGRIYILGATPSVGGSGSFSTNVRWLFLHTGNCTITANTTLVKSAAAGIFHHRVVTNEGDITFSLIQGYTGAKLINGNGGIIRLKNDLVMKGYTLDFSTNPNTVYIEYNVNNTNLPTTLNREFHDLVIDAPTARNARLSGNTKALNRLTVNSGMLLNQNGHDLTVNEHFIYAGDLTQTSGDYLRFSGLLLQTIAITGTKTLQNIEINNAVQVRMFGNLNIIETVDITSGLFKVAASSELLLVSNASGTARMGEMSGSFSGQVNIQRHITAGKANYMDIAMPCTGSVTLGEWDDDIYMSGIGGSDGDACGACFVSVKEFDATTQTIGDFTGDVSSPLNNATGYEVYLGIDLNSMNDTTITIKGTINGAGAMGAITLQDKWNFIGNPYASQIDFATINFSNAEAYFNIFDRTSGSYQSYPSGTIASGQGFWVYSMGGGSVTFEQNDKTTAPASLKAGKIPALNEITIRIDSKMDVFSNTAYVATSSTASNNLDSDDMLAFINPNTPAPEVFTLSTDQYVLRSNTFNNYADELTVPVSVKVKKEGVYYLTFANLENYSDYSCIVLEDLKTGEKYDLKVNNRIKFSSETVNIMDSRFTLHLGNTETCGGVIASVTDIEGNSNVNILPLGNNIQIDFEYPNRTTANISIKNVLGQDLMEVQNFDVSSSTINIDYPASFSGILLVIIDSEYGQVVRKIHRR